MFVIKTVFSGCRSTDPHPDPIHRPKNSVTNEKNMLPSKKLFKKKHIKMYDNIMGTTHWSILDSANGFGSGYSEVKRYEIAQF